MEFNIGKDFSLDPIGRFYSDATVGNNMASGECFREEFLLDRLRQLTPSEKLEIILDDGVEGYGSSFLVEGFAGVVKYGYYRADDFLEKIEIKYSNPDFLFYKNKIVEYIKKANYSSVIYESTKR